MTYNQFLAQLRKVDAQWEVSHLTCGAIRCFIQKKKKNPYCCPITAVAFLLNPRSTAATSSYMRVGKRLGLSPDLITKIADATDRPSGAYPDIRTDLLKACGLSVQNTLER